MVCITMPNFLEISHTVAIYRSATNIWKFTKRSCLIWHNLVKVRDKWITFCNFVCICTCDKCVIFCFKFYFKISSCWKNIARRPLTLSDSLCTFTTQPNSDFVCNKELWILYTVIFPIFPLNYRDFVDFYRDFLAALIIQANRRSELAVRLGSSLACAFRLASDVAFNMTANTDSQYQSNYSLSSLHLSLR